MIEESPKQIETREKRRKVKRKKRKRKGPGRPLQQTLAKAQEVAIAPQIKKARAIKEEQPQTADAEAAAELKRNKMRRTK